MVGEKEYGSKEQDMVVGPFPPANVGVLRKRSKPVMVLLHGFTAHKPAS